MAGGSMTNRYRIAFSTMALSGKLPQGDRRWADFNDSFENLTLAPVEIANSIYRGYSFTTWHDGRRSLANFICGQHVAIDMDTKDERSALDTLAAHPWVRMYASLIYTTPSHTTEAPRARVLFLLDQVVTDAAAYGEIVQFVMSQFDDPDTSCKDASRFFYGSMNCDLLTFDNVLPLAQLRRLFWIWKRQHGRRVTRVTAQPTHGDNVISLDAERTKRRVAALTQDTPNDLERAKEALRKIGPYDVDYNRWIGIIAAMRDEFGEAAFPFVEQWAQGKPGEVRREWDRIKTSAGKSMHVGTIFYLAAGGR
jgi:hypothetical protein